MTTTSLKPAMVINGYGGAPLYVHPVRYTFADLPGTCDGLLLWDDDNAPVLFDLSIEMLKRAYDPLEVLCDECPTRNYTLEPDGTYHVPEWNIDIEEEA